MNESHSSSNASGTGDLRFTYRTRKNGDVEVLHHGKRASTLRGADAHRFLAELREAGYRDGQQLMARLTGNYRRGNERTASNHLRNRK